MKINHRRAREIGCALDLRAFCRTLVKDNYGHDDAEHNRKRGQHTLPKVRMREVFNYAFFQTIELVGQKSNWISFEFRPGRTQSFNQERKLNRQSLDQRVIADDCRAEFESRDLAN